ncbi:MAG: ImpA family type VI secretion system protein [Beijerinckiaceae bacterium]
MDASESAPSSDANVGASPAIVLDPAVAALCAPLSEVDPCGPDLDLDADGAYLNFFASAEGILPTSFFQVDAMANDALDGGKPFDRSTVDLAGQIEAIKPLLKRTGDLRLLIMQARLLILNRDLGGFALTLAAVAEWLEKFWDAVHPRPQGGDLASRVSALAALDLPTVVFPLQYAPLFETRRIGAVTYRAWMIAAGEVKLRAGEEKHPVTALTEAMTDADPAVLAASRKHVAIIKMSLARIRSAFALHGSSSGLENLPALVDKISAFVDPLASARDRAALDAETDGTDADASKNDGAALKPAGAAPSSLAQARQALAAIADYYSRLEPSSPTLPLVRQAHDLIGKSFFEVMSILVPTQVEKAAFQIGAEQIFELPIGRLPKLSEGAPVAANPSPATVACQATDAGPPGFNVQSRSQAIALLDQVQRFFRAAEPSSPVPMLCERARALAERDFMGVLRDVLPKAAFKNAGADK